MRPQVSASIYRCPTCRDGVSQVHRAQVWPSTASSAVRCTHVGPPTPIFFSFQFMVSCRSNASLVRASNLVCIRWFSWRGSGGVQCQDDAEREQEQKKSEWKEDSRSQKCTRIHTDPTVKKVEKQSEMVLDRGAAVAERETNDSRERKASVDQSFSSSRGRSHMHLCLPGAGRGTSFNGDADVCAWRCFGFLPLWAHLSEGFPLSVLPVYAAGPYMCASVARVPETTGATFELQPVQNTVI